jgi:hypothetical protein
MRGARRAAELAACEDALTIMGKSGRPLKYDYRGGGRALSISFIALWF